MDKYLEVKKLFESKEDKENSIDMSKYMRNMFDFYGLATPKRRLLYLDFLRKEKKTKVIDWVFLDKCYEDNHREFQYLAYDYLLAMKSYLKYEDIDKIKKYIVTKSWWDTIDFLAKVIGYIGLKDSRVKDLMIKWSKDDNYWIRRIAILHQLELKDKTDLKLLENIIVNNFGSEEFFINKAIGWALRSYSRFDPDWTIKFVNKYESKMNTLSVREALRYIRKDK